MFRNLSVFITMFFLAWGTTSLSTPGTTNGGEPTARLPLPVFGKEGAPKPAASIKDAIDAGTRLRIPFIKNEGQIDKEVAYYAKTLAGSACITKKGEIVYSLPLCPASGKAITLKEYPISAGVKAVAGEERFSAGVSYFIGNDPARWRSNIPTYNTVDLGEVWNGIGLKLKAHGTNIEKLFYVKPGADPEQIKIRLSGIQPYESSKTEETQPPESPFIKGDLTKSPIDSVVSAQSNESGASCKVGTVVKSPLEKGARAYVLS